MSFPRWTHGIGLALVVALGFPGVARAEPPAAPSTAVEEALAHPPATGLLVVKTVEGSQAADAGVLAGDVIVSYDGKTIVQVDDLKAAMADAAAKSSLPLVVARGAEKRTFDIHNGPIGVQLVPVDQANPHPLPPATDFHFDFSSLAEHPTDDWYVFLLDQEHKAGFEHGTAKVKDGHLFVHREVAFDGSAQWQGINHYDVELETTLDPEPKLVSIRFENPIGQYVATAKPTEKDGVTHLAYEIHHGEETQEQDVTCPKGPPVIPSYLCDVLAAAMAKTPGACFHFRFLNEGNGQLGFPCALLVADEETVTLGDGSMRKARLVEQYQLGTGVTNRYWVDDEGHVVAGDYGGARTKLAPKAVALDGLNPQIHPRTAGD